MNTKIKYLTLATSLIMSPVKAGNASIIKNFTGVADKTVLTTYPLLEAQRAEAMGLLELNKGNFVPTLSMDVSRVKYNGTAEHLNQFLGGVLRGKGKAFCKAQEKYGINAVFLLAIAKHESGNGTSKIARERCNVAGMKGKNGWMRFSSVEECIDKMAKNIKENYVDENKKTISQINRKYAKDTKWGTKILGFIKEVCSAM